MRQRFCGFCLLLAYLNASTHAVAATAAEEFGAQRWPGGPQLTTNRQPELCNKVLAAATSLFTSAATDLDIAGALVEEFPPLEMQPVAVVPEGSTSSLNRLDLDLEGNGVKQVIVYRDLPFNWQGDWHYAYVFGSLAAFDKAKADVTSTWSAVSQSSQYPSPKNREFDAQQYYPSALSVSGEEIQTGDVWAEHSLFAHADRYYFVEGTSPFDRYQPTATRIYRLHGDGRVELTCLIEPTGSNDLFPNFQRLPAVGALLATIRTMGAGGDDGGTLHSGQRHDAQAAAAELRAASRPWATSEASQPANPGANPYYQYDERMRSFLESWSLLELWNRREYQTLLELTAPAEMSYATYLQSSFGLSANSSRVAAVKVIEALIATRFEVPSEYNSEQSRAYFPTMPLHEAVMRRDRSALDAAIAGLTSGDQPGITTPPKPADSILSQALSDAVEWPYGIDRLLAAGADPNQGNEFGKTALMVAAHFDRPDSARKLIKAGASVNASTPVSSGGWPSGPTRTGRTALMYAAENASPATIKVLLDAGADLTAKDSEGKDMSFYLKNNPRLTDAERALGVSGLAKNADEFSGPSFSCAKAQTATENAICGSEVLRIFDAQIARAFLALRSRAGSEIAKEQRQWLQARDQSCSADVDCLAEKMRTHLRYLHERLAE
jgi:ankyrin repeat protein